MVACLCPKGGRFGAMDALTARSDKGASLQDLIHSAARRRCDPDRIEVHSDTVEPASKIGSEASRRTYFSLRRDRARPAGIWVLT
jgi:hypothetical protein